jgi:hypothetical protein
MPKVNSANGTSSLLARLNASVLPREANNLLKLDKYYRSAELLLRQVIQGVPPGVDRPQPRGARTIVDGVQESRDVTAPPACRPSNIACSTTRNSSTSCSCA